MQVKPSLSPGIANRDTGPTAYMPPWALGEVHCRFQLILQIPQEQEGNGYIGYHASWNIDRQVFKCIWNIRF